MRLSRQAGARRLSKSVFTKEYDLFRELLRSLRLEGGLTQDEVAERLGTFQAFVSQCERGERRVDIIETRAFCRAFGIDLAEFVARLETLLEERSSEQSTPAPSEVDATN